MSTFKEPKGKCLKLDILSRIQQENGGIYGAHGRSFFVCCFGFLTLYDELLSRIQIQNIYS